MPISKYPLEIDSSITIPEVEDNATLISGGVVNALRAAIFAVETELGVKPSALYGTVRGRLDSIEDSLNDIISSGDIPFVAAGDLSGTTTNQTVVGIQSFPILNTTPTTNQILTWGGSSWSPQDPPVSFTAGGDLSGSNTSQTVIAIRSTPVSAVAPTINQVLTYNGSDWVPANTQSVFTASGDLSGSNSSQTVIAIRGVSVSATTPTTNQVLTYNGSSWAPAATQNTFTAGGDLSGSSSSQNVIAIRNVSVSSTAPLANQALIYDGSSWLPQSALRVTRLTGTSSNGSSVNLTINGDNTTEFTLSNSVSYFLRIDLLASRSDAAGRSFFERTVFASCSSGTASIISDSLVQNIQNGTSWTFDVVATSNILRFTFVGTAGQTVNALATVTWSQINGF